MELPALINKSFAETASLAKSIVSDLESSKLETLKANLKNRTDFLKKQALISESKEECFDLAMRTANLLLSIQLQETLLPAMSFKESGERGGRGHKACSAAEQALSQKQRHQKLHFKFVYKREGRKRANIREPSP